MILHEGKESAYDDNEEDAKSQANRIQYNRKMGEKIATEC